MIWFTADTHFNHANIIKHCKRPFDTVEEMNDRIISNWNEYVSRDDVTYILGDFAWSDHRRFIAKLKGKKILVIGSHDKMDSNTLKQFTEVHKGMLSTSFNNTRFFLTHCAMLVWEGSIRGSVNLHGHSHGRIPEVDNKRRMDVGVDVWDFKPVPLDLVMDIMGKRSFKYDGLQPNLDLNVQTLFNRNVEYFKKYELSGGERSRDIKRSLE